MEKNKKNVGAYLQEYGALIALVLLVVGISIASPEFRTGSNFLSLLRQSSINGFIAFGMTCVILTDAIDLSVGSVLALSTALCAGMLSSGVPAVLAMIRMAAENAHAEGTWIGLCGELGADLELTEEFLKMGLDELSVSPSMVLPLRKRIRECE